MNKTTIRTHLSASKLPYLDNAGIKYQVIENKKDSVMIDIEVDRFTLIELFNAGENKGISDMATNFENILK